MTAATLSSSVARMEERERDLRSTLEELRVQEDEALRAEIKRAPSRRPDGLNGEAATVRRAIAKAEKELEGIVRELPVRRELAHEQAVAERQAAVRAHIRGLNVFTDRWQAFMDEMRAWHRGGLTLWLTAAQELIAEFDAYLERGRELAGQAEMRGEWEEAERAAAFVDGDERLPETFPELFEKVNRLFHIRDLDDAAIVEQIRKRPSLVRRESIVDPGPAFEPAKPTEHVWVNHSGEYVTQQPAMEFGGWTRIEKDKLPADTRPVRSKATAHV